MTCRGCPAVARRALTPVLLRRAFRSHVQWSGLATAWRIRALPILQQDVV